MKRQIDLIKSFQDREKVFDFIQKPQASDSLNIDKGCILYLEDISVSFDGFKAINNLNLYIDEGELRCIIGPNGAGKTTMMDIITGKTRPDIGSAWFGQTINLLEMNEPEIAEAGIGRKFQKPTVFEEQSVFVNLELAMAMNKNVFNSLFAKLNSEEYDRIEDILNLIGLKNLALMNAGYLSHGQKQWLEIGMLLAQNPKVLLVDEPVAGMTHDEMDRTAELLKTLQGQHTIILVEHDMDFVRSIANKVTVLHQGSVLAEGSMDDVQSNPHVIDVYLGSEEAGS